MDNNATKKNFNLARYQLHEQQEKKKREEAQSPSKEKFRKDPKSPKFQKQKQINQGM